MMTSDDRESEVLECLSTEALFDRIEGPETFMAVGIASTLKHAQEAALALRPVIVLRERARHFETTRTLIGQRVKHLFDVCPDDQYENPQDHSIFVYLLILHDVAPETESKRVAEMVLGHESVTRFARYMADLIFERSRWISFL